MADTKSRPKFSVPPTLEELLNSREADDAESIKDADSGMAAAFRHLYCKK